MADDILKGQIAASFSRFVEAAMLEESVSEDGNTRTCVVNFTPFVPAPVMVASAKDGDKTMVSFSVGDYLLDVARAHDVGRKKCTAMLDAICHEEIFDGMLHVMHDDPNLYVILAVFPQTREVPEYAEPLIMFAEALRVLAQRFEEELHSGGEAGHHHH